MKDNRSKTSAINGKLGGRPKELLGFKAFPKENWRPVKDHDSYFISDMGRVITVKTGKPKLLKTFITYRNYECVSFSQNYRKSNHTVHGLVLQAFISSRPKGFDSSHLDGNTLNNNLSNLIWESRKDNCNRKKEHGTWQGGENNSFSKLVEKDILSIRQCLEKKTKTPQELADFYNVKRGTIYEIKSRKRWKHV